MYFSRARGICVEGYLKTIFALSLILLGQADIALAQCQSATTPILVSIFVTIAVMAIIFVGILYWLRKRWKKPKGSDRGSEPSADEKEPAYGKDYAAGAGFDNPLVVDRKEPLMSEKQELENGQPNKPKDGELREIITQPPPPATNHEGYQERAVDVEGLPANGQMKNDNGNGNKIQTIVLNKSTPTNGFNIIADNNGNVFVHGIRKGGPASGKLLEGDIIESVTVFYEGISYEDALNILSFAAPYKVAISLVRGRNHLMPGVEGNKADPFVQELQNQLEKRGSQKKSEDEDGEQSTETDKDERPSAEAIVENQKHSSTSSSSDDEQQLTKEEENATLTSPLADNKIDELIEQKTAEADSISSSSFEVVEGEVVRKLEESTETRPVVVIRDTPKQVEVPNQERPPPEQDEDHDIRKEVVSPSPENSSTLNSSAEKELGIEQERTAYSIRNFPVPENQEPSAVKEDVTKPTHRSGSSPSPSGKKKRLTKKRTPTSKKAEEGNRSSSSSDSDAEHSHSSTSSGSSSKRGTRGRVARRKKYFECLSPENAQGRTPSRSRSRSPGQSPHVTTDRAGHLVVIDGDGTREVNLDDPEDMKLLQIHSGQPHVHKPQATGKQDSEKSSSSSASGEEAKTAAVSISTHLTTRRKSSGKSSSTTSSQEDSTSEYLKTPPPRDIQEYPGSPDSFVIIEDQPQMKENMEKGKKKKTESEGRRSPFSSGSTSSDELPITVKSVEEMEEETLSGDFVMVKKESYEHKSSSSSSSESDSGDKRKKEEMKISIDFEAELSRKSSTSDHSGGEADEDEQSVSEQQKDQVKEPDLSAESKYVRESSPSSSSDTDDQTEHQEDNKEGKDQENEHALNVKLQTQKASSSSSSSSGEESEPSIRRNDEEQIEEPKVVSELNTEKDSSSSSSEEATEEDVLPNTHKLEISKPVAENLTKESMEKSTSSGSESGSENDEDAQHGKRMADGQTRLDVESMSSESTENELKEKEFEAEDRLSSSSSDSEVCNTENNVSQKDEPDDDKISVEKEKSSRSSSEDDEKSVEVMEAVIIQKDRTGEELEKNERGEETTSSSSSESDEDDEKNKDNAATEAVIFQKERAEKDERDEKTTSSSSSESEVDDAKNSDPATDAVIPQKEWTGKESETNEQDRETTSSSSSESEVDDEKNSDSATEAGILQKEGTEKYERDEETTSSSSSESEIDDEKNSDPARDAVILQKERTEEEAEKNERDEEITSSSSSESEVDDEKNSDTVATETVIPQEERSEKDEEITSLSSSESELGKHESCSASGESENEHEKSVIPEKVKQHAPAVITTASDTSKNSPTSRSCGTDQTQAKRDGEQKFWDEKEPLSDEGNGSSSSSQSDEEGHEEIPSQIVSQGEPQHEENGSSSSSSRSEDNEDRREKIPHDSDDEGGPDKKENTKSSSIASSSDTENEYKIEPAVVIPEQESRFTSSSESSDDENDHDDTQKNLEPCEEQKKGRDYSSSSSSSEDESKKIPEITQTKKRDDIVLTSGWRKAVKLVDLIRARLILESTVKKLEFGEVTEEEVQDGLKQYLVGDEPIAGLLIMDTGEKLSLLDACKKGIIRRGSALSLLEAQAATGSIINPITAEKMSVKQAAAENLIDRQFQAVLERAERAVHGYVSRLSPEPLSLFEAMKRKLVVENHGIRLLEAQIATGGIIDPQANHRLPVEVAFERGLFDERLQRILEDPSDDTKGFFDPNTKENLTYLDLMQRCILDRDTNLRLLPLFDGKSKKQYSK